MAPEGSENKSSGTFNFIEVEVFKPPSEYKSFRELSIIALQ